MVVKGVGMGAARRRAGFGAARSMVAAVVLVMVALAYQATLPESVLSAPGDKLFGSGSEVTVTILMAETNTDSELGLYSAPNPNARIRLIGTNRETGKAVNLGVVPAGQELIFGIKLLNPSSPTYFMGEAARNPDIALHASVTFSAPGVAIVGFEDGTNGGDKDYNDNMFRFEGVVPDGPPPVIMGTRSPLPNAAGWNNTAVTVTFSCNSADRVASVTAPVTVATEVENHVVTGTCRDIYGRTATTTVGPINIDLTPPELQISFDLETKGIRVQTVESKGSLPASQSPIAPTVCSTLRTGDSCLYRGRDNAGNSVTMTLQLSRRDATSNKELVVRATSVQYSGRVVSIPLSHNFAFNYIIYMGTMYSLDQYITTTVYVNNPAIQRSSATYHFRALWPIPRSTDSSNAVTQLLVLGTTWQASCPGLRLMGLITDLVPNGVEMLPVMDEHGLYPVIDRSGCQGQFGY